MELRHLRYFVAVAEELHFGRAAERLHISQPPLSQQIKQLEDILSVRLFERTNRRVELTEAGLFFLSEARATLERADRASRAMERVAKGELGTLRVALFPSALLIDRIGSAILTFRQRMPGVQLVLDELESKRQAAAVEEGRNHIAIMRSHAKPILPKGLVASLLLEERMVVAMRADHPLASEKSVRMEDLEHEPFIFYGERMGSTMPQKVYELCNAAGFEPNISQMANTNTTIIGLVAAGIGVAVVPQAMCRLSHDMVVSRPIDMPQAVTGAWIVRQANNRSPVTGAFLDLLYPNA